MEKPTDEGSDDKNDVEGKASSDSNEEVGDQAVRNDSGGEEMHGRERWHDDDE